ncbi:MAG: LD-carboxypeptidase [Oscillospiraceae bacterium]|nr:LD-carboxypeptidase [Oscillospiraceae bacterium]
MNTIKYPKALEKGDLIALVSPSSPCREAAVVDKCADFLIEHGYRVKVHESCYAQYGYLSGNDEIRAQGINSAFADKNVDAVFCIRGGYGTPRIVDMIDYDLIAANPKIFCGYSDITGLHIPINQKSGLVTFHAPMLSTCIINGFDTYAEENFNRILRDPCHTGALINPVGADTTFLSEGKAEGMLIGGNLSLITALSGSRYALEPEGKIIFIEDIDEGVYRIDRMLTNLRLCGVFDKCAGVVFGAFTDCEEDKDHPMSVLDVIKDVVLPCGKPVMFGLSAGHITKNMSLPLGARAALDSARGTLEILPI